MENKQKFGVPVSEGKLDNHFGHCKKYALLEVVNGEIQETIVDAPEHEPGVLPRWLAEQGVTDVIAGGVGQKAIKVFEKHNVNVFVGAPQLTAKELVEGFVNESIEFNSNCCNHGSKHKHTHSHNHSCNSSGKHTNCKKH